MKRCILILLAAMPWIAAAKTVKSTVKQVTVFTQGAQVFRSANVNLQPGTTELVFSGLSPHLQAASLQAGGKGDFIVLEARHNIRYPEPPKEEPGKLPLAIVRSIDLLEDSITELGFRQEELTEKRNALLLEKNMIQKNKLALGEGKSDSLAVLRQAMEFFRAKLADINAQLMRLRREDQHLQNEKTRMSLRLADLHAYRNDLEPEKKYEPLHEITVTVSAEAPVTGTVEISYYVTQAGWTPSYDLRSGGTASPVKLTYKAHVFQSSGEEWNDVSLRLSTGNPNRGSTKPELPVWYLNYYYPQYKTREGNSSAPGTLDATETMDDKDLRKRVDELSAAQSAANYSQLVETMTNVEFDIRLPYSIPSDGVRHVIAVKSEELPALYRHYLVPRYDREAFLIASITGWESLNLLPGSANIFFEGTFVGQTVLNPVLINDTLNLSLGRDRSITITRTRLPETLKNKLLGNEVTKTVVYELKMKSARSSKINLVVEDQVPVSQNKDIKIDVQETAKADYNSTTGMLRWDTTLGSRESKTFTFRYAVTYQKGMQLSMF